MLPMGPFKGELALPCPCGEAVDFYDDRVLNLIRYASGKTVVYHDGCMVNPDVS